jgi:hypothetical protein
MAQTIHDAGHRAATGEQRTLRGALVFLALVALALLAVVYPGLAAATALGGLGGLLVGVRADRKRA